MDDDLPFGVSSLINILWQMKDPAYVIIFDKLMDTSMHIVKAYFRFAWMYQSVVKIILI